MSYEGFIDDAGLPQLAFFHCLRLLECRHSQADRYLRGWNKVVGLGAGGRQSKIQSW